MSRKSYFSILIILFCSLFSAQILAESLTIGSAINKAGRQRMLTQNILKNHLLLGLDVDVDRARKDLDQSVALFERQFQMLSDYAPTHTVKESLERVENLWMEYRALAISPASKGSAIKMLDQNNAILRASHQVVLDLQGFAGRTSAEMVNVSGRQRMLSQRIAAYYFALTMEFDDKIYHEEFKLAKSEYELGLKKMVSFNQNTEALEKSLKRVNAQWKFSKTGFDQSESGNYVPHVIAVTTSGMLKRMDTVTDLYEKLDSTISGRSAVAATHSEY